MVNEPIVMVMVGEAHREEAEEKEKEDNKLLIHTPVQKLRIDK